MGLLTGVGKHHIEGYKELSAHEPIVECKVPDLIYVPLVDGAATDFDVLVEEGDHVDIGTRIALRKGMYVPIYSPVSGTVVKQEKRMHATKRPQNHIVIENDHKDTKVKILDIDRYDLMTSEEIVNAIKELGIVGMGGSGFPTYIKYNNVKDIDTIIINGVECEPYITSDYNEMLRQVKALFDGTSFFIRAAHASKGIIAIKEGKVELYELLLEEAKNYKNITPVQVKDVYPMGWERLLVKTVTKRTYDKLPSEAHVIVSNAMSAISLSHGIREGLPVIERLVTVSGDGVKHPCNVLTRVGTCASDVIEASGGYIDEGEGHIIAGGPMMGKSISNDRFVISEYMNALTVLTKKEEHTVACLRCGECTLHCPMNLQPVRIMQSEKHNDADALEKLEVNKCIECGMCTFICPSKIEVTDFVQKGKRRLALKMRRK